MAKPVHLIESDTFKAGIDAMSEYSRDAHGRYMIRGWVSVPEYKAPPHRFKKSEWHCTKRELVESLTVFYQVVLVPSRAAPFQELDYKSDWWPDDIDHFLRCAFHLVRGPTMLHHARCIVTLIRQGVVARSVHRLEVS